MKPGPGAREKELIIGVESDGKAKAYRLEILRDEKEITDEINGRLISLSYNKETDTVTVTDKDGEIIDHMTTYWMVWRGIYPETVLLGE